jgi:hypothetical protein
MKELERARRNREMKELLNKAIQLLDEAYEAHLAKTKQAA